jgi:hypothetical protein
MTPSEPQNETCVEALPCRRRGSLRRPARARCLVWLARGDHQPDSDYDIAVFIKNPGTLTEELDKLASLTTAILLDTGAVISAKPFYAGGYQARTAFMHDLRKDGLDL